MPLYIVYAVPAVGLVVLPVFMGFMGRELRSWARPDDSHLESVVVTTLMPWLFGTLHVLLIYWPLPRFIMGPIILGSVFWFFAVAGVDLLKCPAAKYKRRVYADTFRLDLDHRGSRNGLVADKRNSFRPLTARPFVGSETSSAQLQRPFDRYC
jgi:hypothetical protein